MAEPSAVTEQVIEELERVLGHPLTCEEIRLLLLARIIEEQALDREVAFAMELELLKSRLVIAA